jgi:hypothetical protein
LLGYKALNSKAPDLVSAWQDFTISPDQERHW